MQSIYKIFRAINCTGYGADYLAQGTIKTFHKDNLNGLYIANDKIKTKAISFQTKKGFIFKVSLV